MATQDEMEKLSEAMEDARRAVSKALYFDVMARAHWLLPWVWAATLILWADVLIEVTAAVLGQVCGGECFR